MEYNFDLRRLLLCAACLVVFAFMGGFSPPQGHPDGVRSSTQARKAWFYCVAIFVAGAVAVSLVDHSIGVLDPVNLRPAYIVFGALLMVASCLWLRTMKQALTDPEKPGAAMHVPPLRATPDLEGPAKSIPA